VKKAFLENEQFTKHLFGADAYFNDDLRCNAACLRVFRDENFETWETDSVEDPKAFVLQLRNFYENYAEFIAEMCQHNNCTKERLLEFALKRDIHKYSEVVKDSMKHHSSAFEKHKNSDRGQMSPLHLRWK
jgi:hypothetical protein